MENNLNYNQFFHKLSNGDTPEGFIKLWKSFVGSLYNGYIYTNCEFDHDLGWREDIEDLIFNQELLKFEEHKKFIDHINYIDFFYKKITIEIPDPRDERHWFYNRILKYSNNYYIEDYSYYYPIIVIKPIEYIDIDLKEEKEEVMNWVVD
ncbi:MAG: hypothetical protein U0354_12420 [Candidatus Sericytochromatia bacterium]